MESVVEKKSPKEDPRTRFELSEGPDTRHRLTCCQSSSELQDLLAASLLAPSESLRLLTPYVDFLARIHNEHDGAPPQLVTFESVDNSGDSTNVPSGAHRFACRFRHFVLSGSRFSRERERECLSECLGNDFMF